MRGSATGILSIALFAGMIFSSCTRYDLDRADTEANRRGFEQHFGFVPPGSVTGVYYYADELGIDVSYQLSFKCQRATVERIIRDLSLRPVPPGRVERLLDPRDDLPWWQPGAIDGRDLWIREEEQHYHRQLWYSERDQMAFYLEYSV
ncbi:MAG: hypothetical protein VCA55_01375 [Verrucomicrobiales bacterium]